MGLLFTLSKPIPKGVVFQPNREVLIIAKELGRISVTEPYEVLGIFKQAVTKASNAGIRVQGLDLVRILEIIFDPALAIVRQEEDAAFIHEMFAQNAATPPVPLLADPTSSDQSADE